MTVHCSRALLVLCSVLALVRTAHADKPRVLVVPVTVGQAVDADVARAFDARLLVAIEATRRVSTVTLDDELDCTTPTYLAEAGKTAGAGSVLSLSIVRESSGLTLFASLLDTATARPSRRVELPRLTAAELADSAPTQLAQRLFGAPAGPAVVGIVERGRAAAAAAAISSRLAALGSFTVVSESRADVTLTHRAEVEVTALSIRRRRHHVHHYLDGVLAGRLTIVELGSNRVVFAKSVSVAVSRRARYSSTAEVSALLVDAAASDWMTAFLAAGTETLLQGESK